MVICCDYMCLCVAIICAIFVATKCGYVLRLHVVICVMFVATECL